MCYWEEYPSVVLFNRKCCSIDSGSNIGQALAELEVLTDAPSPRLISVYQKPEKARPSVRMRNNTAACAQRRIC
jgi:hypothetical protein